MIELLCKVYHHDAMARERKLDPDERLAFHQEQSGPVMEELKTWCERQISEKEVQRLIPDGARVVLLGDGEFDGVDLQALVNQCEWEYVLRSSKTTTLSLDGQEFCFNDVADHLAPGDVFDISGARFTQRRYGPVLAITWWRKDCKEPIHLVSNMVSAQEACGYYRKRFKIETFFSDQKSRGFHIHKSHLSDPKRLSRLLIAASLAYLWIVYLGAHAMQHGWNKIIHRTDRCDLSLFQLGLRLLDHFLNEELPIPVAFMPSGEALNCVR